MNNEPVAWMHKNPDYPISKNWSQEYNIPLYTHPAKTLTDEEIVSLYKETGADNGGIREFARAILKKASEK